MKIRYSRPNAVVKHMMECGSYLTQTVTDVLSFGFVQLCPLSIPHKVSKVKFGLIS